MRCLLAMLAAVSAVSIQTALFARRDGERAPSHQRGGDRRLPHLLRRRSSSGACEQGKPGCKSLCRWMMLGSQDENFKASKSGGPPDHTCPQFEAQLSRCRYVVPEEREKGASADPMDCSVSVLRRQVAEAKVADAVDELAACVEDVPESEQQDCHLAVDLINGKLTDFSAEVDLRVQADVQRDRLEAAMESVELAIETKTNVQAAMDQIAEVLDAAEQVPGNYITETIHSARDLMEQLGAILPVLFELHSAEAEGHAALASKDAYRCEQAIFRLGNAMNDAAQLKIGAVLEPAEQLEDDLLTLSSAAEDLNAAIEQANSSWSTVSRMGKSLERLRETTEVYSDAGLTDRLEEAGQVFDHLLQTKMAFVEIRASIVQGEAALSDGQDESEAIDSLEDAVEDSNKVKLHRELPLAVDVLHELLHQEGEKASDQIGDSYWLLHQQGDSMVG